MRPSSPTLPLSLEFDVHWSARAARHICRTTDRILNLLRGGGGADIDRWGLRRERRSASLSARHFDAHRRENVRRQERNELVDEAQLRLDLRRAVRALRSRMDCARWHEPENPPGGEGLLDDLVRGSQPGFNGGVITRERCDEEAGDSELQNPVHRADPPSRWGIGLGSGPGYPHVGAQMCVWPLGVQCGDGATAAVRMECSADGPAWRFLNYRALRHW